MAETETSELKKITLHPMLSEEDARAVAKETLKDLVLEEHLPETGQMIAGEGVFLGQYAPKDRDGKSLGKIFNIFAAPEDLRGGLFGRKKVFEYIDAVKRIAKLKDWNGFDGTNYSTDKEIYKALKEGSYNGGWIIPTNDILRGNDFDGQEITPDNLFVHQNKGSFKGTFYTEDPGEGPDSPHWYWSSTENRVHLSQVHSVRLSDGFEVAHLKDQFRLSCRPVRLVEVHLKKQEPKP